MRCNAGMTARRTVFFTAVCAAAALLALGIAGCQARDVSSTSPLWRVEPVDRRPVVIAGQTLVLPMAHVGMSVEAGAPPDRVDVVLEDGRSLDAALYWAWAEGRSGRSRWIAPANRWRVSDAPPTDGTPAAVLLFVDVPGDAKGQWMDVAGVPMQPIWLEPSGLLWEIDLDRPQALETELLLLAAEEAADPARRWRAALLADRLHTVPTWQPFDDPRIEAIADQAEAQWRGGLDRLAAASPTLAREVRRALTRVCTNGPTLIPAWPVDEASLAGLLHTLVLDRLTTRRRIDQVEAWRAAQPQAVVWPIADGDADHMTIRIANLCDVPQFAILTWDRDSPGQYIDAVDAERIQRFQPTRPPDRGMPDVLHVEIGSWRGEIPAAPRVYSCAPPGYPIGPFAETLDMATWLAGRFNTAPVERATRAIVRRTDLGWELFVECRSQAADGPGESPLVDPRSADAIALTGEAVYVFFGRIDKPRLVLGISRSGEVRAFHGSATDVEIPVVSGEQRWVVTIPIRSAWIDAEGRISIGVVRSFQGDAWPTSWPMPMFPWRVEPGRVTIDLCAWDGMDENDLNG
ncbi:MAG: hypothetical protein KAS72_10305 [Phycisphaerales bacterium]|nr:hypothetical protein [Phycisphaerales bacterium]